MRNNIIMDEDWNKNIPSHKNKGSRSAIPSHSSNTKNDKDKSRKRYSAAEKRAYWLGVGVYLGNPVNAHECRWEYNDFYCGMSEKELDSYQAGLRRMDLNENLERRPILPKKGKKK